MSRGAKSIIYSQAFKTFKPLYKTQHVSLTGDYILNNPQHPLRTAQIQIHNQRKKEGLWWFASSGLDTSHSSCVRSWARRRLRNAIKEELEARGYNEKGIFVNAEALKKRPEMERLLQQGESLDLSGTIRLHATPALVPASYVDVKAEVSRIIEALVPVSGTPKTTANSVIPPRSQLNVTPRLRQQRIVIKEVSTQRSVK